MKRDPSGAMERTVDCPVTVRLRRIEADAVSYTNSTVDALLLMVLRPTMKAPSGVRVSLPRNVVVGRVSVMGGSVDGVGGGGENCTGVNCCVCCALTSKTNNDWMSVVEPVPSVVINARPSAPTSTPSGFEGRLTVCRTCEELRSITLSVELALLLTYKYLESIDIAPATGVEPTRIEPASVLSA